MAMIPTMIISTPSAMDQPDAFLMPQKCFSHSSSICLFVGAGRHNCQRCRNS